MTGRPARFAPFAALLVLAAVTTACRWDATGSREAPNVVIVTIDTLRASHCSTYGYARPTTPVLDRIAAEGALFESAYAPMATTGPSHATLFTSLYPQVHGVVRNGLVLGEEHLVLAERLRKIGYDTAGFVSSFVLDARFGYDRGFGHYDDDFTGSEGTFRGRNWEGIKITEVFDRRADETTDAVIAWMNGRSGSAPLFLFVHYFDPHRPFVPPPPYDMSFPAEAKPADPVRLDIALYDGEILFTDTQLGRLVDHLDATLGADRTILIVTADHGEGLMDHGWPGHGPLLYEEDVRVPLLIRWSGRIPPGGRISQPSALLDLAPTVRSLLRLDTEGELYQGSSLAPLLLDGETGDPNRPIHLLRRLYETEQLRARIASTVRDKVTMKIIGDKFALRVGRWKYIEAPDEKTRELYDLQADPPERNNLAAREAERADSMSRMIAEWADAQALLAPGRRQEISPEDLRRLRSLGYVP